MKKERKQTLGKILRENREEQNLSKQQVCRGLCTVMALSRYEADERTPNKFLIDALLERLGFQPFRYEFVVSEQEFYYSTKRAQIEELLYEKDDISACWEMLKEYGKQLREKDNLHWQYIFLKRGILLGREKKYTEAISVLKRALEFTDCEVITAQKEILLTDIETEAFYLIGKFYYLDGNKSEAGIYFNMLKNYIEQRKMEQGKWKEYYPCILYRLAQCEFEQYNFGKSYEYVKLAEKILVNNYEYDCLCEVLCLKEKICEKLGIPNETDSDFVLALQIISKGTNGKLTNKGFKLWENTVSQLL